jgi:HSP20 family molecular chaperone IbpA
MAKAPKKTQVDTAEPVDERPAVAPAVDIFENDDEYLIVADVPSVTSDSVRLNLDEDQLTLRARRADDTDFKRSFYLPDGVDFANAAADLKDGVLSVHLPKAAAVKPRRIAVNQL